MRRVRVELCCGACGNTAQRDALELLRAAGMLKRAGDDVDEHLIVSLLGAATAKTACQQCGHIGVHFALIDEDDDWPAAECCRQCGQAIPIERLRLFPHNGYCAACQARRETGAAHDDQREFCPWCGQTLGHKTTRRRGVTEYVPACPACGYVG